MKLCKIFGCHKCMLDVYKAVKVYISAKFYAMNQAVVRRNNNFASSSSIYLYLSY